MIVHKDKITFKECHKKMKDKEFRQRSRQNEGYKKLRDDIKEKGMINPLLCIEENGIYKICVGIRRFMVGEELGMTEFKVKILPNDNVHLRKEEIKKQIPTEVE